MEYDDKYRHKIKFKRNETICGVEGHYRRTDDKNENENVCSSPKVDRHGFVKSHKLHSQVSSNNCSIRLPGEVCIKRESKWLDMIGNWDEVLKNKDNKIKERCRKGIPQSVRSLAWQHLTASNVLRAKNPNLYEELIKKSADSEWDYVIRKDIPRTFRHHSMFYENNSRGQEDLYNVLMAYSTYDVETGYNQALAPVAAVLLMHMPPDESFWILVSICKYYLPGYYGQTMEAMRLDALMFSHLLETEASYIFTHMANNDIEPMLYLVEWMVCIFSRSLPFDTVLRIWDMFFCEGFKILFKVALAILKVVFPTQKDLEDKDDDGINKTLSVLPKECVEEDILIAEILGIELSYKDLRKVHKKVLVDYPELDIKRYSGGHHVL